MAWTLEELMAGEEAASRAVGEPIPEDLVPKVRSMVIAVMNRAIELRRLETIVWRQRVEKAAEALADVAPGELGRLDLVGRIERLKTERDEAVRLGAVGTHERDELNREIEGHGRREEAAIAALAAVGVDASLGLIQGVHAIIARLKPSGQVAAGVRSLEAAIISGTRGEPALRAAWMEALSRLAAGAQEAEALRGDLILCQQERDAAENRASGAEQDRDSAPAEVERLKAQLDQANNGWAHEQRERRERRAAESRLAATQTELDTAKARTQQEHEERILAEVRARTLGRRIRAARTLLRTVYDHYREDEIERANPTSQLGAWRDGMKILEGDAPQQAKKEPPRCTCNTLQRDTQWHDTDCPRSPIYKTAAQEAKCPHDAKGGPCDECAPQEKGAAGPESTVQPQRYPCSPTCTHDDNVNPGHPERVRQRSKAVKEATDPVGALAKEAGAKPGREVASYRCGYEQACDDMRAACWEAIQPKLEALGVDEHTREFFKRAIEGSAP